jgi:hypothetical protein
VTRTWTEFLRGSTASAHAVQIYDGLDELAESVAAFLAAGLEAGEPALVVATGEHWTCFAARLARRGWDVEKMERHGVLAVRDAEAALAAIMTGANPSPLRFEQVVAAAVDAAAERFPARRLRVFGEMVDLLWQRGQIDAALALEELWNDLATTRRFSLLCGYGVDVFDRATQVALSGVCRTHSHVEAAYDGARLARAVELALEEVLGRDEAGKVYVVVGEQIREERVPIAQLALMWVSANAPHLAERILAAARAHYVAPAAPAAG